MKDPFKKAKEVLDDLDETLSRIENTIGGMLGKTHCDERRIMCWLHGATELIERIPLEKWLFESLPISETAMRSAAQYILIWQEHLENIDAYYHVFEEFELPDSNQGETLRDYIIRMGRLVENEGRGSRLEWRALKSFLAFMRKLEPKETAFIEQIFPFKMDIHHSRIIRLINPEVYPIPQEIAAAILVELARTGRSGRLNAQHGALEALGLCWLCLSASRLRLPITLDDIHKMKKSSIQSTGEYPELLIPTLSGEIPLRISKRLSGFLTALSEIPSDMPRHTILQKTRRSLSRALERSVSNVPMPDHFGKITIITFISPPHIFGADFRFTPKR